MACRAGEHNRGFDDERGDYKPYVHDHLAYRFEILSILGKGSFGQVLKCYDHKARAHRAVKIIRNKARFHQQAKMELKILHHLVRKVRGMTVPGGVWCALSGHKPAPMVGAKCYTPCRMCMASTT